MALSFVPEEYSLRDLRAGYRILVHGESERSMSAPTLTSSGCVKPTPATRYAMELNDADECVIRQEPRRGPRRRWREAGLTLVQNTGFYGATERLLTYQPGRVWHIWATEMVPDLTVFACRWLWLQSAVCVGVALMVMWIVRLDQAEMDALEAANGSSTPSDVRPAILELDSIIDAFFAKLNVLIAFLFGNFVALNVAAWKERRTNYASLIGATRNLLIQFGTVFAMASAASADAVQAGSEASGTLDQARGTLGRYALLAVEFAILKARGHLDSPEARHYLLGTGLLNEEEYEATIPGDRHTTVYFWIQTVAVRLCRQGLCTPHELQMVGNAVTLARAQANDLMSSLDRDVPYPYASSMTMLVKVMMVLYSVSAGLRIAEHSTWYNKVVDCVGITIFTASFQGLLNLQKTLHNPFLSERLHVAHEAIAGTGLKQLSDALMEGKQCLPPSLRL